MAAAGEIRSTMGRTDLMAAIVAPITHHRSRMETGMVGITLIERRLRAGNRLLPAILGSVQVFPLLRLRHTKVVDTTATGVMVTTVTHPHRLQDTMAVTKEVTKEVIKEATNQVHNKDKVVHMTTDRIGTTGTVAVVDVTIETGTRVEEEAVTNDEKERMLVLWLGMCRDGCTGWGRHLVCVLVSQ